MTTIPSHVVNELKERFGQRLKEGVLLASLTTARVGGPAAFLITIESSDELADTCRFLWQENLPMFILGAGSNVLFSDQGFSGVVLLNRAKSIQVKAQEQPPQIWAESGANLGMVARKAALSGLSGLEWATSVPGTVGGAVYGNAGAHGGDIAGNLRLAEILQQDLNRVFWSCEDMHYAYRSSSLKRSPNKSIILSATFQCNQDEPEKIQQRMSKFSEHRRSSQPPGASMGSMFKNPPGDYAGRLIEEAGLKGTQIGGVKVSEVHANFFINNDQATASDIWQLIQKVRSTVEEKTGALLELEVEPVGFNGQAQETQQRGKSL